MENLPLVSVIVPCFNQAQFLNDALQSVLNQTYPNWECIIVNDGSPDDTETIASSWCKKDVRFKYVKKQNGGLSSARNAGIQNCAGVYILPLDADDKISPNYIEECLQCIEQDPSVKVVYGKAEYFGAKRGEWKLPEFSYSQLLTRNIVYCTALYRKLDWIQAGGYDENMKSGLEDWDFWLSMISENDRVVCLQSILFHYRIKEVSMVLDLNANYDKTQQVYNYIYQKHRNKINTLIGSPIQLYLQYEEDKSNIHYITRGAKALGIVGRLLYGILRKTGFLLEQKKN